MYNMGIKIHDYGTYRTSNANRIYEKVQLIRIGSLALLINEYVHVHVQIYIHSYIHICRSGTTFCKLTIAQKWMSGCQY